MQRDCSLKNFIYSHRYFRGDKNITKQIQTITPARTLKHMRLKYMQFVKRAPDVQILQPLYMSRLE